MLDFRRKQQRFRRPDFQDKLARARKYERKAASSRTVRWTLAVMLLIIIYFLTISSVFLVDEVAGAGEEIAATLRNMRKQRVYLIPANHILILNKKSLLESLQKEFPQVRDVTHFKRILPDKIEVNLEERQPLYIWQSGTDFYLLDQDGVIFQKISKYDPAAYSQILITDSLESEVKVGQEMDIKKILDFIVQAKNLWPQQVPQTNFVSFEVPGAKSLDIFVKTGIGFEVYFDLGRNVQIQLANLALLLSQEIKPETYSGLSYIDLRLPQVAYYCYKDAPCAQK